MKSVKKGRPQRKEKRHVIWLTTSTFRLWNERRKAFELKNKSNSEFAEVLLHGMMLKTTSWEEKSYGLRRIRVASPSVSPIPCKSWISLFTSQFLFWECNLDHRIYSSMKVVQALLNLGMFITIGKKPFFASTPKDTVCTGSQLKRHQAMPQSMIGTQACSVSSLSAVVIVDYKSTEMILMIEKKT